MGNVRKKAEQFSLVVNGSSHLVEGEPHTPLLYFLRNDLALNSPKFGCGLGECGACTVLIDGKAVRSCAYPVRLALNHAIVTLEGLGSAENPHVVQEAFVKSQAAQCGYCVSGIIMTTTAFLDRHPDPTEAEVREALRYNLCRCGTHVEIVNAVMLAAQLGRERSVE